MSNRRVIKVIGAREHNLKNITIEIPKEQLTVITGPSGSGKSSLALDILYAEGQRRYMESLSSYARQFLGMPKKPDVERIEGLCPAIAIEQKTVGSNPRSTVGTITEIYDYLRVLFARIGTIFCPGCHKPVEQASTEDVVAALYAKHAGDCVIIAAPVAREKKGEFAQELEKYFLDGFFRFIIDGVRYTFKSLDEVRALKLKKTYKHTIFILLDAVDIIPEERARVAEAVDRASLLAQGKCTIIIGEQEVHFSSERMCMQCSRSFPELEPRLFSFNNPMGACKSCHGLGVTVSSAYEAMMRDSVQPNNMFEEMLCPACHGMRLHKDALSVEIDGKNIFDIGQLSIRAARDFFEHVRLEPFKKEIAARLLHEIKERLTFLIDVGLDYLSLNRTARTLSGGEGQRIRLATQMGSSLSGVLYILDEPSIGLHQRDNDRLIATLKRLRDAGNTVVVVEHDHDTMLAADHIIDMGPQAGTLGGLVVAEGTPTQLMKNPASLSGAYLSGAKKIERLQALRKPTGLLTLHHARTNNLKDVTVAIPLGVLCGISGVSGSGKSSLIMDELVPAVKSAVGSRGAYDVSRVTGVDQLDNLVVIDQTPIGRTPRSNPATYLGIFDDIRKIFAAQPESNARGYTVSRFSFNVGQGRCATCEGDGSITISMHFLPDVITVCNTCKGSRYNAQTLEIVYKGKNISQVLDMTAREAAEFFEHHTSLAKRLKLMCEVGLDYVKLGQPSTTLSGGEAQRIKLVDELAKRGNKTLYVLDEPTTGLHTDDIKRLLEVFNKLVNKGNSLVVIEHNLDVLKTCDHIIDLGPEGGDQGGTIVVQGTPEQVAQEPRSYTGKYLKPLL